VTSRYLVGLLPKNGGPAANSCGILYAFLRSFPVQLSLFSPKHFGFNDLRKVVVNYVPLASDLHLPAQLTKIGFPGWPEPILDSVTGLGASINEEGGLHRPPFSFLWALLSTSIAAFLNFRLIA